MKYLIVLLITMMFFSMTDNTQAQNSKKPQYVIHVFQGGEKMGDIKIQLYPDVAPKTVANFDSLVSINFYDGTAFHRVIPGFMIQGGDPNSKNKPDDKSSWGMGDPSQTSVPAEFSDLKHKRGILSMARRGDNINSATSQFFIMHDDATHLDGQYTIFGEVTEGIEVVDKITEVPKEGPHRSAPVEKITMKIEKIEE